MSKMTILFFSSNILSTRSFPCQDSQLCLSRIRLGVHESKSKLPSLTLVQRETLMMPNALGGQPRPPHKACNHLVSKA